MARAAELIVFICSQRTLELVISWAASLSCCPAAAGASAVVADFWYLLRIIVAENCDIAVHTLDHWRRDRRN